MVNYDKIGQLLLVLTLTANSCVDDKCGRLRDNYIYELVAKMNIVPERATYLVGDTVFISIIIPRAIENRRTNEVENIIDLSVDYRFYLNNIEDPDNRREDVIWENVSILEATGGIDTIQWPFALYGKPARSDDGMQFEYNLTFIFDSPGVFWLNLGRFNADGILLGERSYQDEIVLTNECPNGKFKLFYEVNGGGDNHWSLLCETNEIYCSSAWDESVRSETFDRLGGYVFKVTE